MSLPVVSLSEEQLFAVCEPVGVVRSSDAWREFVAWYGRPVPAGGHEQSALSDESQRVIRALWIAYGSGHDKGWRNAFREVVGMVGRAIPCQRCAALWSRPRAPQS